MRGFRRMSGVNRLSKIVDIIEVYADDRVMKRIKRRTDDKKPAHWDDVKGILLVGKRGDGHRAKSKKM